MLTSLFVRGTGQSAPAELWFIAIILKISFRIFVNFFFLIFLGFFLVLNGILVQWDLPALPHWQHSHQLPSHPNLLKQLQSLCPQSFSEKIITPAAEIRI